MDSTDPGPTPVNPDEDKILPALVLIIGATVGLVVAALILLTDNLGAKLYPAEGPGWLRLVAPIAGSLAVGALLNRYFPNARGSGIPQTKTALFLRSGFISLKTALGKFCLTLISLASGIALGREDPSVLVAGGIASTLGRRYRLSSARLKELVPVSTAAAISAALNAPISAVLFALEGVAGDVNASGLGSIVLASAISWMVLHLLLGDEPLFHVPAFQLVTPIEFAVYAALGVVAGLGSAGFTRLLLWQRRSFRRASFRVQGILPVIGGITTGFIGWFYPDVMGGGYSALGMALNGEILVSTMAVLVVLKMVATATCYASGNAGGILGPSLFMGVMLGGAVGGVAHMLMPSYTAFWGAYGLVGMGAVFAGIVRVPLTSVFMVFEITRDYSIILPVVIANLISYFVSRQLQEEPIFDALLHQDGIHLPSQQTERETRLLVGNTLRQPVVFKATDTIADAMAAEDDSGVWPVSDASGFRGMLTGAQLKSAVAAGGGERQLATLLSEPDAIDDPGERRLPYVYAESRLDEAMRRMNSSKMNVLPVVSRANNRELKGIVRRDDILAALGQPPPTQENVWLPSAWSAFGRRLKPLAGVITVMLLLAGLITLLSNSFQADRSARAERLVTAGDEFMSRQFYTGAVEQYRQALKLSPSVEHRAKLAAALVKTGNPNEAQTYWNQILSEQPENGAANLGLARTMAAGGYTSEALRHYDEAIYGTWPGSQGQENQLQAQIEMAKTLNQAGRRTEAQSRILALVEESPGDPAARKQIAAMLTELGLFRQAALFSGTAGNGTLTLRPQGAASLDIFGAPTPAPGSDQGGPAATGRPVPAGAANDSEPTPSALDASFCNLVNRTTRLSTTGKVPPDQNTAEILEQVQRKMAGEAIPLELVPTDDARVRGRALAVVCGARSYILFDAHYFQNSDQAAGRNWTQYFILAHELSRLMESVGAAADRVRTELDADLRAGQALGDLDAPATSIRNAVGYMKFESGAGYPDYCQRLKSAVSGYNRAANAANRPILEWQDPCTSGGLRAAPKPRLSVAESLLVVRKTAVSTASRHWTWLLAIAASMILLITAGTRTLEMVFQTKTIPLEKIAVVFYLTIGRKRLFRQYRRKIADAAARGMAPVQYVDLPFSSDTPVASDSNVREAILLLKDDRNIAIIADGGRGKTTLCAAVLIECSKADEADRGRIVVTVDSASYTGNLIESLTHVIRENGLFATSAILEAQLSAGNVVVIFDGFSEVPDAPGGGEAGTDIIETIRRFPLTRFIFTSRKPLPPSLNQALQPMASVSLIDLDRASIRTYLSRYLVRRGSEIDTLIEELDRLGERIPPTPLMLRLVAELFEDSRTIPAARTDLFRRYVEKLLRPEAAGGQDPDGLDFALRQLVRFSYLESGGDPGFTNDRGVSILAAAKDMLTAYGITMSPQKVLRLLLSAGVLRKSGSRLRFFHDSFEAYFAAKTIETDWEDRRYEYLATAKDSPNLRETWELLVELEPSIGQMSIT